MFCSGKLGDKEVLPENLSLWYLLILNKHLDEKVQYVDARTKGEAFIDIYIEVLRALS